MGQDYIEAPAGQRFVYKQDGEKEAFLEVYFPPDHKPETAKVPAILMFHGGGWSKGSPEQFRYFCNYFSNRGLVTATVSYTLGEGKEACIIDGRSAIRWMKQSADRLGIDPERLVVGGGSAGGQIAFVSTLADKLNDRSDATEIDTSVAAYILFSPAFSLLRPGNAKVNAVAYAHARLAPMIVFYAEHDPGWLKGWAELYPKLLELERPKVDYWVAPEQRHGFFNTQPWLDLALVKSDQFLVELGLLSGSALISESAGNASFIVGPKPLDLSR